MSALPRNAGMVAPICPDRGHYTGRSLPAAVLLFTFLEWNFDRQFHRPAAGGNDNLLALISRRNIGHSFKTSRHRRRIALDTNHVHAIGAGGETIAGLV